MMNNKIKRTQNSFNQQLTSVIQQAFQNKQELEQFYLKNKMKFPPIFHPRHIVMTTISPIEQISSPLSHVDNKTVEQQHKKSIYKSSFSQTKPRICDLIFQLQNQENGKKSLLVHDSKSKMSKIQVNPLEKNGVKVGISDKNRKLKFGNQSMTTESNYCEMKERFKESKSKLRAFNRMASHNVERESSFFSKNQNLDGSLMVGSAVIDNPQSIFIQTLRQSKKNLLENNQACKRRSNIDLENISFYRHADGLVRQKNLVVRKKDLEGFEPWQMGEEELVSDQFNER